MDSRQMIVHHQTLKGLASLVEPSVGSEMQNFRQKSSLLIFSVQLQPKWKDFFMIFLPLIMLRKNNYPITYEWWL